jgi:hypothetical protein
VPRAARRARPAAAAARGIGGARDPARATPAPLSPAPNAPPQLLWAFSILALLPLYLSFLPGVAPKAPPLIPHTHLDVVSGAAAVVSFVAELFMLKALLVYEAPGAGGGGSGGGGARGFLVRRGVGPPVRAP